MSFDTFIFYICKNFKCKAVETEKGYCVTYNNREIFLNSYCMTLVREKQYNHTFDLSENCTEEAIVDYFMYFLNEDELKLLFND